MKPDDKRQRPDTEEDDTLDEKIDRGEDGITKSFGGPAGPPTVPEPRIGQKLGVTVPAEENSESR